VDSVVVGNSIIRECHFLLDGSLADPTLPRITIRNPAGTAVVQDAVPTRLAQGIYQYAYAVPLDAPLGIYLDEWIGTLNGEPAPASENWQALPIGSAVPVFNPSYTYNPTTTIGLLRLLVQDNDLSSVDASLPMEQRSAAFSDEELEQFLGLHGNDLYSAAAAVLRTWATSKQLIIVARRIGKADVDYGSIRADLLKMAEAFDDMATEGPADGVAEIAYDEFAARRIVENYWLRHDL
jgi:hypothetical protein